MTSTAAGPAAVPAAGSGFEAPEDGISMVRAVGLGWALRWRLARNRLRKGGVALFVLALVAAGLGAAGGFALFASTRLMTSTARHNVVVLALTLLVLGWTFMPLTGGGADETVDPTRLALLPLRRRQLLGVLAGAASSGPATLAVFIALCGLPVGVAPAAPLGLVVTILCVPVAFVLGLGVARLAASLLVRAQRSRKGRDLAVLVSGIAGVSIWLASQSVGPLLQQGGSAAGNRIVRALSWLPTGWIARAALDASDGRAGVGLLWLLATAAVAALVLAAWASMAQRLLATPERTVNARLDESRPPLGRASGPLGAAVAKELRYLRRSPGRRVQFLLGTLMGVGFALIQVIQASSRHDPRLVFYGLWGVVFTLGGSFNLIGFDSGSMWLDVLAGGPGREQLVARTVSWLPLLSVPPLSATLVIAVWSGEFRYVPMMLALSVMAAGCGLGVAAWVSVLAPVPYADGDNPFAWRQGMSGKGCVTAVYTVMGIFAVVVFGAPVLIPCVLHPERRWAIPLALLGVLWGAAVWAGGLALGTRRLNGRGPALLAELSPRSIS